jgi:hypothetical protein
MPILQHIIEGLRDASVRRVLVVVVFGGQMSSADHYW